MKMRKPACDGFACYKNETAHPLLCHLCVCCYGGAEYASGLSRIDRPVHEMRRSDVSELHRAIEDHWDDWVQTATTSGIAGWNECLFLKENVPIAISVRYGQNQPVCKLTVGERNEEADHWHRIHDYTNMRAMTFALATHIQYVYNDTMITILTLK